MSMLLFSMLALALLGGLGAYGLRRARRADVPATLATANRAVLVLTVAALGLVLVNPADVPAMLRAIVASL